MIFGSRGAALQAQGGTLLLRNAEELTLANQYRLCQLIRFQVCHGADIARMRKIDVRIMITIECPLPELEAEGKISSDLYFLLSGAFHTASEGEKRGFEKKAGYDTAKLL